MTSQIALLVHLDLLPQLVAEALQALPHRGRGQPRALRQPLGAPAAVVVQLAQTPLFPR
jgi:hypothetical protein